MSPTTHGRLPHHHDDHFVDDVTTAAARAAVERTLQASGTLHEIIRAAVDRAVQTHVVNSTKTALADALAGDFGEALDEQIGQALVDALSPNAGVNERRPVFANVADWVRDLLLPSYQRPTTDLKWCPYWFEHTEALARLEALWRAWEHLRHEGPTGPAVWFRDYCDPTMRELTAKTGPFHACKTTARGGHTIAPTWDLADPPPGLFRGADHPEER